MRGLEGKVAIVTGGGSGIGGPSDYPGLVAFLASDDAAFMTARPSACPAA